MAQAACACLGGLRDGIATVRRSEAGCLSLAFMLAALIRWELMPPPAPAAASAGPAISSQASLLNAMVREERGAAVSSILRRPLFRAGRRPAPAAVPDPPPLPRLSGIVVTASARRAIFADGGSGETMVAAEGESLGLVKVARISAQEVVVIGPDGVRVLRPAAQSASERAPLVPRRRGAALPTALRDRVRARRRTAPAAPRPWLADAIGDAAYDCVTI